MSKKEERFIITYKQGVSSRIEVLVDKETGVNYLYRCYGYGGGLTPLLDADGKTIVTPLDQIKEYK